MENTSVSENSYLNNYNIYETIYNIEKKYPEEPDFRQLNYRLTAETGKNLFRYLKSFNLFKDPGLLILPPNNHYYFDEMELKEVKTLINLKNLNLMKDLRTFLRTLILLLPSDANFIGYFSSNKMTLREDGFLSVLSKRINNILDSRTDHNLDKKGFSELLEKSGFRVIDMTEMNGLTYFYSQNMRQPLEMRS